MGRLKNLFAVAFAMNVIVANAQTLREIKSKYIGKTVFILPSEIAKQDALDHFEVVSGKVKKGMRSHNLSASYLNLPAKVSDVSFASTLLDPRPKAGKAENAMGEVISDDDLELAGHQIQAVLKFEDGTVVNHAELYSALLADISGKRAEFRELQFAEVRQRHSKMFADGQQALLGKTLYIPGYDWVFDSNITLDQILSMTAFDFRIRENEVPALSPAEVVAVKYIDSYDRVLLKLRLKSGREVLYAASFREEEASSRVGDSLSVTDDSLLGRVSGRLLISLPPQLTNEEIQAVQNGQFFKGMSETAVFYLKGRTSTVNSYGDGGFQLVYGDSLIVYLDAHRKVTSWQTFSQ